MIIVEPCPKINDKVSGRPRNQRLTNNENKRRKNNGNKRNYNAASYQRLRATRSAYQAQCTFMKINMLREVFLNLYFIFQRTIFKQEIWAHFAWTNDFEGNRQEGYLPFALATLASRRYDEGAGSWRMNKKKKSSNFVNVNSLCTQAYAPLPGLVGRLLEDPRRLPIPRSVLLNGNGYNQRKRWRIPDSKKSAGACCSSKWMSL